jgi:Ca2+-binding RTX toxin-like protein
MHIWLGLFHLATQLLQAVSDPILLPSVLYGFSWKRVAGADTATISTGGEDDTVITLGTNTVITSGAGDDLLFSGVGDDVIYAGSGNDIINLRGGTATPSR